MSFRRNEVNNCRVDSITIVYLTDLEARVGGILHPEPKVPDDFWNAFPGKRRRRIIQATLPRINDAIAKATGYLNNQEETKPEVEEKLLNFLGAQGVPVYFDCDIEDRGMYRYPDGIQISASVNGRLRTHTLVHGASHYLYDHYGNTLDTKPSQLFRWEQEAESSTYMALRKVGLDVQSLSVPYLAGALLSFEFHDKTPPIEQMKQNRQKVLAVSHRLASIIS